MFSRLLNSKIFFLLILLIIGYLGYASVNAFLEKKEINDSLASLNAEIEEMKAKKEELKENEEYYSSQEFLEKEARRLLNYQKPGEEVIAVIPSKEIRSSREVVFQFQEEELKELSNSQKWLEYFFGKRD